MSCDTCKYYDRDYDEDNMGICKRYAPHPDNSHSDGRKSGVFVVPFWPTVSSDDWCGEWKKYASQDPAREI